jgi:hypothetical protein
LEIWRAYLQRRNVDGGADPGQQNVAGDLAHDVSNRESGHGVVQLIAVHVEVFLPAWLSGLQLLQGRSLNESQVGLKRLGVAYIPDTKALVRFVWFRNLVKKPIPA